MDTQAEIAPALAAIHNFIWEYDSDEVNEYLDVDSANEGNFARGPAGRSERGEANMRRDNIANAMWAQYQQILATRK